MKISWMEISWKEQISRKEAFLGYKKKLFHIGTSLAKQNILAKETEKIQIHKNVTNKMYKKENRGIYNR